MGGLRSIVSSAAAGALAGLVVLGLFATAGLARADDKAAKPHIDKVSPEEARPGGTISAVGTGFPDSPAGVEATVGGVKATILLVQPERIMLLVPRSLTKGKAKVVVTVGTQSSNGADVMVDPKLDKGEERKKESPVNNRVKVITLEDPQLATDAAGKQVVHVAGATDLPPGCNVSVTITMGDSGQVVIDSTSAEVRPDKRIEATLGPFPKPLAYGRYWATAKFRLGDQPRRIEKVFNETYKDATELKQHESGMDRATFSVGSNVDVEAATREVRGFVDGAVGRLRALHRDLEVGFGQALRSDFRKGKDVDEKGWEDRLSGKSLQGLADGDRAKWLKAMREKSDFLTTGGAFAEPKWREWMDGHAAEELTSLEQTNQGLIDRYAQIRERPVLDHLMATIHELRELACYRSRELYQLAKLPYADQDTATPAKSAEALEKMLKAVEVEIRELAAPPKK
jgi:hypothetical protein